MRIKYIDIDFNRIDNPRPNASCIDALGSWVVFFLAWWVCVNAHFQARKKTTQELDSDRVGQMIVDSKLRDKEQQRLSSK